MRNENTRRYITPSMYSSPSFDDVSRVVVGSLSTTFDTSASVSFPHGWSSDSDLNLYLVAGRRVAQRQTRAPQLRRIADRAAMRAVNCAAWIARRGLRGVLREDEAGLRDLEEELHLSLIHI